MKKITSLTVALFLITAVTVFAGGRRGDMPAPRLIEPADHVDLTGKTELEFRWGMESGNFDVYDFKLFKGPQPYEPYMILQKDIPARIHSTAVDASQFEAGETYSWALRCKGARKSPQSYSIFRVKAK